MNTIDDVWALIQTTFTTKRMSTALIHCSLMTPTNNAVCYNNWNIQFFYNFPLYTTYIHRTNTERTKNWLPSIYCSRQMQYTLRAFFVIVFFRSLFNVVPKEKRRTYKSHLLYNFIPDKDFESEGNHRRTMKTIIHLCNCDTIFRWYLEYYHST